MLLQELPDCWMVLGLKRARISCLAYMNTDLELNTRLRYSSKFQKHEKILFRRGLAVWQIHHDFQCLNNTFSGFLYHLPWTRIFLKPIVLALKASDQQHQF